MKKTLLLILCIAAALNVQARLGETYDQCVSRYGRPASEKESISVFSKPPFKITIGFRDNRAVYISYEKPDSFMNARILKTECAALLELNRAGFQWSEYRCPEQYRDQHILNDLWQRTDGAMACYEMKSSSLLIVQKSLASLLFDDGKTTTNGL